MPTRFEGAGAAMSETRRATMERAHDLIDRIAINNLSAMAHSIENQELNQTLLFGSRTELTAIVRAAYEAMKEGSVPLREMAASILK